MYPRSESNIAKTMAAIRTRSFQGDELDSDSCFAWNCISLPPKTLQLVQHLINTEAAKLHVL